MRCGWHEKDEKSTEGDSWRGRLDGRYVDDRASAEYPRYLFMMSFKEI
jgi:hypothetical protein